MKKLRAILRDSWEKHRTHSIIILVGITTLLFLGVTQGYYCK